VYIVYNIVSFFISSIYYTSFLLLYCHIKVVIDTYYTLLGTLASVLTNTGSPHLYQVLIADLLETEEMRDCRNQIITEGMLPGRGSKCQTLDLQTAVLPPKLLDLSFIQIKT